MATQQDVDALEEEDTIQDWSQVAQLSRKNAQNILPKRGEKEFEPDGTNMQELLLYKVKREMFSALNDSIRGTIVKSQVIAVYIPRKHQALILNPKGTFLQSMGTVDNMGQSWLNIYEFLYLSERGSVTPYWDPHHTDQAPKENNLIPLGIEDIYSFLKTQDEMNTFMVYAHLKRLGFVVQLANELQTTFYPPITRPNFITGTLSTIFDQVSKIFQSTKRNLFNGLFYNHAHYSFCKYTTSAQLYNNLKLLVPYVFVPKTIAELRRQRADYKVKYTSSSPFQIKFNVWKPETNFKKKITELPDYQIVLYDKNDNNQHFPTLEDLKNIFNALDYKFDFLNDIEEDPNFNWDDYSFVDGISRRDMLNKLQKRKTSKNNDQSNEQLKKEPKKMLSKKKQRKPSRQISSHARQLRRLKTGYRSFLLAVIDNGIISFVKLCEADFGSEDVWYVPTNNKSSDGSASRRRNDKKLINLA